ncbi:MAG: phosphoribosylglycinamide formyltransferase, partial [Oscillospiraceae bacterium]|nr:phosphoribosylglycinamide formyltransferase [Oscillospiraceae bacterium]MBQ8217854.1 phosphoribosylglycinamide formyltransferase [Oscillospiraceae bacterium]
VGNIILQKAVDILHDDTPETLRRRVMEEGEWKLLSRAVALYCAGRLVIHGNRVLIRK